MNYSNDNSSDGVIRFIVGAFGLLLLLGSIFFLFSVEGMAKKSYLAREFARKNWVETAVDNIDAEKEGKIVCFTGMISSDDTLSDKAFNISVDKCLTLKRKVEMYQYYERRHRHKERRGKNSYRTYYTYSYHKDWFESINNSNAFNMNNTYRNPNKMKFRTQLFNAKNVCIGAHKIPSFSIEALGTPEKVHLASFSVILPDTAFEEHDKILFNAFHQEQEAGKTKKDIISVDDRNPEIGDTRIVFYKYPLCEATVFGVQKGENLFPFAKDGFEASFVKPGKVSADEMLKQKSTGELAVWACRIIFFFVLSGGFFCLLYKTGGLGCFTALLGSFGVVSGIACCVWLTVMPFVSIIWLSILIFSSIIAIPMLFNQNR